MRILVTGGAGYIGSHVCKVAADYGNQVVVFDNLSRGHERLVKSGPLVVGDIRDTDTLTHTLRRCKVDAVVHCAALAYVGESEHRPSEYHSVNVAGTLSLCEAMTNAGVRSLVFSSSCSVYGNPTRIPVLEEHAIMPISVYAQTKADAEGLIASHSELSSLTLRFFNAAGSAYEFGLGECHDPETHIIPLLVNRALGMTEEDVKIFSRGIKTGDGSPTRDFVHVLDIAEAHIKALEWVTLQQSYKHGVLNIGSGTGTSIFRLIKEIELQTGVRMAARIDIHNKRRFDPECVFADISLAESLINWKPKRGLEKIVHDAIQWARVNAHKK